MAVAARVDGAVCAPLGAFRWVVRGSPALAAMLARQGARAPRPYPAAPGALNLVLVRGYGYFTEVYRRPVQDIGRTSVTGTATVILSGFSVGLECIRRPGGTWVGFFGCRCSAGLRHRWREATWSARRRLRRRCSFGSDGGSDGGVDAGSDAQTGSPGVSVFAQDIAIVGRTVVPRTPWEDCMTAMIIRGRGGRTSEAAVLAAAPRLTGRDRFLVRLLGKHRVLTTRQVRRVAFDSEITARHRLAVLTEIGVLARFRPHREVGSAPWHYVLDALGVAVHAAEHGQEPDRARARRDKMLAVATSQRLGHLIGVNEFFTSLMHTARCDSGDAELEQWWPEQRCRATAWGPTDVEVTADGYGCWREHGRRVDFFLEHDTGSEHLPQLAGKLDIYAEVAACLTDPPWLLFQFPGVGREANARRAFTARGDFGALRIATSVAETSPSPAEAVWWPLHLQQRRYRLADLAGIPSSALFGVSG